MNNMLRTSMKGEDFQIFHEEIFVSDSGNQLVIPFLKKDGNILIQVSGGMDSGLLLYLLIKTITAHNLDINVIPISLEVTTKLKSLHLARQIRQFVSNEFNYVFQNVIEEIIPVSECTPKNKDLFFKKIVDAAKVKYNPQIEFNGDTKNPPENIRKFFTNDKNRRIDRDHKDSVYISNDCASPLGLVDKHDIVFFYKQFNLFDTLAPITMSCDENIDKIEANNLKIPCEECWWCQERLYGFTSNGLTKEHAFRHYQ